MATPHGGSRLGTRFGPYELRSLIGVGGMGEVYRAYDTVKGRMVALKLLRAEMAADPGFQERFRRESRVAARLQEPHVIPVHDFGDIGGVLYIDMRLVEGASLKDELRANGPLDAKRAASIVAQVAAALDAAHADGLVHRDIKPENVLLNPDDFAYLVDFGIAHTGGDPGVTSTGMIVGSSAYMAPERFSGGPVGPPADVYSLTCLLYECLTARAPFETGDLGQLMSAHMFAPPPRPSIMRRGVSRAFDDVIARGMAKQPGDRFASAGELAKAATAAAMLPAAAAGAVIAPASPPPSTRQFSSVFANPAATGYTPYPPPAPPRPAAEAPAKKNTAQVALIAAIIVMFGVAAVLAAILAFTGQDSAPTARTTLTPTTAPYDESVPTTTRTTTPTTTTTTPSTTTTTSTTPSTSTTGRAPEGVTGADAQGFVGHYARCDSGGSPAAMVRTAQSLAIVCRDDDDNYYYRGERLSDGATIQLDGASPAGGGYDAVDPSSGARYEVRPDRLTIVSNGRADTSERVLEYYAD
ncbi:serine/threonine-protein kinase [Mycolicibacterium litorale]|uniref:non-specific serine/threonine protein kinase n=1 Tax=Mycolicibacterium litorale TaxID=758802 RepID=A0AAD1II22_9MYCO|nr:serine/threonine-protein kinase [Mycolicibacterium litorale]MCV7414525.1 serine/threonine protein kinase [Mycolicibacterium litorale]TDY01511.1 serine/threonine protein kinase [Mycolicibacterium litorale]BBY15276.1 protein kinase [Mycolicibacterium litorale]